LNYTDIYKKKKSWSKDTKLKINNMTNQQTQVEVTKNVKMLPQNKNFNIWVFNNYERRSGNTI